MSSPQPTSHMRAVTMLKIPKVSFKDDFMWHKQYLYVDQVNDQSDIQWRMRVYDSKPKSEKHYQNYQTSVMIRDITISIFPSLQHLYNTVPNTNEWKPRPASNSSIYTNNESGNFIIVVLSPSSKAIFSAKEAEMLELLDLFRLISPVSCAAADQAARQQDGLILDPAPSQPTTPSHITQKTHLQQQQPSSSSPSQPSQQSFPISPQSHGGPTVAVTYSASSTTNSPTQSTTSNLPVPYTSAPTTTPTPTDPNPSILKANPNPNTTSTTSTTSTNGPNSLNVPNNRTLTRLPTTVFSPQLPTHGANGSNVAISQSPSSLSIAKGEVDNPTAGLTDEMFSDHFALGTPPSRPTIVQGTQQQPPLLSLNATPRPSSGQLHISTATDIDTASPGSDEPSSAGGFAFKSIEINEDEEQYSLLESQSNLQSSSNEITHVASSSIIKPSVANAFRNLFGLPDDELLLTTQCSYIKSVLLHGSMYITNKHLCFYSSLFGYRHQIKLPISDIIRAETTTVGGIFGGGLKVTLDPEIIKANGGEELYIFASLRGPTKARIIETLERVGEHINLAARAAEIAFAKAAKAEAIRVAEKEKEKAEKEKEKLEKEKEKALAKAASQVAKTSTQSSSQSIASDHTSVISGECDEGDEEGSDDENENTDGAPPAPPCNLPLYNQIQYPDGLPPPPQPAIYVSIAEEFSPVIDKFTINLSLSQLWDIFLCNTAPHGLPVFLNDVRKEQNIRVSQWTPHTLSTDKASDPHNPFAGAAEYMIRQVAFNAELNAPMTPPRVDILKRQVCAIWRTNGKVDCLKLIGISSTPEAPFGKDFAVCEQFTINPIPGQDNKLVVSLRLSAYFLVPIGWKLKFIVPTLKSRVKSDGTGQHQEWLDFINQVMSSSPSTPSRDNFYLAPVAKIAKSFKKKAPSAPSSVTTVSVEEIVVVKPSASISEIVAPPCPPKMTIAAAAITLVLLAIANCSSLMTNDRAIHIASLINIIILLFTLESKR